MNRETVKEIIKIIFLCIVIYIFAFTDYVKSLNTIVLFIILISIVLFLTFHIKKKMYLYFTIGFSLQLIKFLSSEFYDISPWVMIGIFFLSSIGSFIFIAMALYELFKEIKKGL
jgi:hypothetical protein